METNEKKSFIRPKNPRQGANVFSILTFGWTLPMFWKGRKKEMEEDDLFAPLEEHKASYVGDLFERAWCDEIERSKRANKKPDLKKVVIKVYGFKILLYGLMGFITEIISCIAQPLLLGKLLDYFTSDGGKPVSAYLYAAGMVVCSAANVINHSYMLGLMHLGMKIRVALSSLIYRKALKLSDSSLKEVTVGHLVNLLSNDVNKFDFTLIYLHTLWIGPIESIIITYFVWELIGPAAIIGLITLLIFTPFQVWLGKITSSLRLKIAKRTDERVRLMNEIITGIKVIKMYTWEKPFADLVSYARRKELNVLTKSSYCKGVMFSFVMFHTRITIFLSLLAYVLFGNAVITAKKVFVVTGFYNSLKQSMTIFFPFAMASVAEALVSIKRIQAFLLIEDLVCLDQNDQVGSLIQRGDGDTSEPIVTLKNAHAKWNNQQNENTLTNINLSIHPGKLVSVIGPVGAGKSSLLHLILKELPLMEGSLKVNGSVSYSSQDPWLFVGSVRQNILFGLPYVRERYKQVVRVCALTTDFEQLPNGDKTIIGEKGISLSGGQKARVSLARAVYRDADLYLLDDPLSAVDTHVGKHLFDDCIADFLKGKTVILITHQLQYLNNVDNIFLLEIGHITAEGNFNHLLSKGLNFTKLLITQDHDEGSATRRLSISSDSSTVDEYQDKISVENVESMFSGNVKKRVYSSYFTAGGGFCVLFITILFFILAQAAATGGDYWTAYWVNLEQEDFPSTNFIKSRDICIYIFAALIIATVALTLIRYFVFFYTCMKASFNLHKNMYYSISRATMRFFHINSSGRILNRFSSDMGSIDESLPPILSDIFMISTDVLGSLLIIVTMNPWILIPTVISSIIFYYMRMFYLNISRSIKRLEGITRSPVFSHLTASLQGLTTIRAYKLQKILQSEFESHQDLHSTAWYLFIATHRAFGFWLDFVCLIYVGLVTFSFLVIMPDSSGGAVGLAITQSISLIGQFQWAMRLTAELESTMTSVERVLEYSNLYSEPQWESQPDKKPQGNWPNHGEIEFEDVSLRYSPQDMWVLKNLSFTVSQKEKVGIVGRTGAGKSSLITALFRLSEAEGQINIDGVDTRSLGLHDLRSKLSIIPQDPFLFSGSLRKNLDPFDQYPDTLLWNALEEVELKDVVKGLAGGLNSTMAEGGSNFSVGQRQLVCLARAIVRNNKILVLDEATANIDPQTDALIQKTIGSKFAECTVLTIAHRLLTVMDSDKVLVIDAGMLAEFDHPHILLEDKNSLFTRMVGQTNKSNIELLRRIALQNFEEKKNR